MKFYRLKAFLFSLLVLSYIDISAQFGLLIFDFDSVATDTIKYKYFVIDTISNPNNIWQIGKPAKTTFDSAFTYPNALVTDLTKPYPVNDTSSFLFYHYADNGFTFPHTAGIAGRYKCDSDSMNDYGLFEFSPDNGKTWLNLNQDSSIWWIDGRDEIKANFSGRTSDWVKFDASLGHYGIKYNIQQGDTVIFKISFISDSIFDNRDGWMLDHIYLFDLAEGIFENENLDGEISIFPNPANSSVTFELDVDHVGNLNIEVYNRSAQLCHSFKSDGNRSIEFDVSSLPRGLYFVKIRNEENGKLYGGRVLREEIKNTYSLYVSFKILITPS